MMDDLTQFWYQTERRLSPRDLIILFPAFILQVIYLR
jgi:hypothetical protein